MLKRNGKEYERLSDHVGLVPAVIVSPADSALISDASDERRRYLNAFISQLDRSYLTAVMRYNAVLAERNRLLKNMPDETMLQIYDMQLVEQGERIHARRREFAERLQPVAAEYYRILSGDRAADFTTELKLENHILYARIQSSVLRSELFYQREALKEELNRRSGVRIVNAVIIR